MTRPLPASFPSKAEILDYIKENPDASGKRDIARAFGIRGDAKILLRNMLREMRNDGLLVKRNKSRYGEAGTLPSVTVIEVVGLNEDGEPIARPSSWREETPAPTILLSPGNHRPGQAAGIGDRVLARLERLENGDYQARTIRKLAENKKRMIGLYFEAEGRGRLQPADKRIRGEFLLRADNARAAKPGDLVLAELLPNRGRSQLGLKEVKVIERLGSLAEPKALSLIAIHEHSIPASFPSAALEDAKEARDFRSKDREDLRNLPLVTVDGADARDFDDAVFARPDESPENRDGWEMLVAIADVAHYVRPGSPLDREASKRGNSVYFPDRVVPMLPEALSNGWCSLNPGEDRPCLAVWIQVRPDGRKLRHRFLRGIMKSASRLTYEAVQAFHDKDDPAAVEIPGDHINHLFGAFECLLRAREERGALDLDLPERRITLDEGGNVREIKERERLDSHRLIEEFMIMANVAAAEELERLRRPCMYRIHESPDPQKIDALSEVLKSFDLNLPRGQVMRPKLLNRVLNRVSGHPEAEIVHQMILRAQSQAVYSPENIGHFGLALTRYAHFTSPIRRYADLMVHRALITGLALGPGGLKEGAENEFGELAEHISYTERRAAVAERDTLDRFTAAFLAEKVGCRTSGKITNVTNFGLFIRLDPSGGDGLLPMSDLPEDFYRVTEGGNILRGERWGREYALGQTLEVKILTADRISGAIRLSLANSDVDTGTNDNVSTRRANREVKPGKPGRQGKKRPKKRKIGRNKRPKGNSKRKTL